MSAPQCRPDCSTALLPIDSRPGVAGHYIRVLVRHGDSRLYIAATAETERRAEADVEEQVIAYFAGFHA